MTARVVIVAGGGFSEEDLALLQPGDFLIGVDGGAVRLLEAGRVPHVAVGDFDTAGPAEQRKLEERGVHVHPLPAAKDVTDTHEAVDRALKLHPREILLLGGLGGSRFDHALANLFLLEWMDAAGVAGILQNAHNRIRLHTGGVMTVKASPFPYVSLLALTDRAEGVTLEGFRYPLEEAVLIREVPLGVSNELAAEEGRIRVRSGKLLVIESRDRP
ncbi:thiamine diphosphokinase [Desmospora profundinema]|uniref:Thiamine diphosphokinase n=1 Tax=Desmospora profundinema TaxID=1571184 RepID=A0ABU1IR24_9BACL|nr:thiamine diphosphokinase [Desmospora profundinema]MDR6227246.1 thiamine pyrophosphokinase [Desmospora profundinema]